MECRETTQHLDRFLLGELPPGRMRRIQIHLGGCIQCRRALRERQRRYDVVIPFYLVPAIHGELTAEERQRVDAHLAYCEACREDHEDLRAASNELVKNLSDRKSVV